MLEVGLEAGTKCIVIGNVSRHNMPIGSKVSLSGPNSRGRGYLVNENRCWFALEDLRLVNISRKDLEKKLSKYQDKIKVLSYKIDYLNESKSEVVDEEKFKEYSLSKILESDITPEEKASSIIELLGEN